ncbi:glycosyltransferase family 2 protein [Flavobacterium agricola]|uniref:Glycosyltransferase family 2 protein n=1 Tax=Flavobacterium agricola TaxID=2870839 RepID=A0ABY6LXT1_9FLAO|nr:glycosyltransferase [Flavobacterium agricola]UYW01143.1 glycosyltransferase family 2 protein [Flavobacterium agricola]
MKNSENNLASKAAPAVSNKQVKQQILELVVLTLTLTVLAGAIYFSINYHAEIEKLHLSFLNTPWGKTLVVVTAVLFVLRLSFLLFNLALYFFYKETKMVGDEKLPSCTVIVPAYNEGELVYHTLESIVNSDYPAEKLEIITVDDGSKDDTWFWMNKAKLAFGDRIMLHQQPKNMGKRHALYYGFKKAKGDVVITIDSDSIIEKHTLRSLNSPFAVNPQCGAVAGNVKVLNLKSAMIPKMLNVSFAFSFEFIRSAQSALGSVFCTPGALAAYRKSVVLIVLENWMNQTFLGKPSDIGEDRALTNMILKQGYEVLFQKNAKVYTNTPERYKNLYKMYIRWERSNIRETIMMSKFAFTDFRKGNKLGIRIILINQWIQLIFAFPLLLVMLTLFIMFPVTSIITTLVGIVLFSSIQMLFFAQKHSVSGSLWAYPYSIFYAFSLFWITPYSIATAGKSGWLTR